MKGGLWREGPYAMGTNGVGLRPVCKLQKGCTRLAAQVIKLASCFPMVGCSLRVL